MKSINGKKFCPRCKTTKSVGEFNKMHNTSDGYKNYCKSCCHKEYLKHQDHYCKQNREYIFETKMKAFKIVAHWKLGETLFCSMHDKWKCCGNKRDIDFLSLDHIYGDGASHRREIRATASTSLYRWVIKNPVEAKKRLQLLCMNAQFKKKKLYEEQKYTRNNI